MPQRFLFARSWGAVAEMMASPLGVALNSRPKYVDLSEGGRATYYMTGPDGEKLHAWWRIVSVDPPRSRAFEEGNAHDSGPNDDPPTTSIMLRIVETTDNLDQVTVKRPSAFTTPVKSAAETLT